MQDEKFMQRALELAENGRGAVSPNPMVGCVVVHDGIIIGEGFHAMYGGPHAEVNAVSDVRDPTLLPESTVYVTLEPCAHFGKTPPCADLLIAKKVKRVVVATTDSNPIVAGKGIAKLGNAGIEITTGILEQAARKLNERFFVFMEQKRPYIILKWAETRDNFFAREDFDSKWISDAFSRRLVHKWRTEEDAILVGSRTAVYDNPKLNVRDWTGRNPTRILIDRHLAVPESHTLFDGTQLTLCYNLKKSGSKDNTEHIRLGEDDFLKNLLNDLYARKIQSVMVEGGAETLKRFLEAGFWDEARVFVSPQMFVKGIVAPIMPLAPDAVTKLEADTLHIYTNDLRK